MSTSETKVLATTRARRANMVETMLRRSYQVRDLIEWFKEKIKSIGSSCPREIILRSNLHLAGLQSDILIKDLQVSKDKIWNVKAFDMHAYSRATEPLKASLEVYNKRVIAPLEPIADSELYHNNVRDLLELLNTLQSEYARLTFDTDILRKTLNRTGKPKTYLTMLSLSVKKLSSLLKSNFDPSTSILDYEVILEDIQSQILTMLDKDLEVANHFVHNHARVIRSELRSILTRYSLDKFDPDSMEIKFLKGHGFVDEATFKMYKAYVEGVRNER